jgi:hypothetical protein
MPAFATAWRKNKNYAIRNAAAVQYCSLLEIKSGDPLIKDIQAQLWLRNGTE